MPKVKAQRAAKPAPDADPLDAGLAAIVGETIDRRGLTQTAAAIVMDDAPSQVCLVRNGKLRGFSTKRLMRMLNRLGYDVRVSVKKARTKQGDTRLARTGMTYVAARRKPRA